MFERVLNEAGAEMRHLVKFNTYYVFEGEGDEIREYWEKMTAVRLEFLGTRGRSARPSASPALPIPAS